MGRGQGVAEPRHELLAEAKKLVGPRGLSSLVNEALRVRLQQVRVTRLLDETPPRRAAGRAGEPGAEVAGTAPTEVAVGRRGGQLLGGTGGRNTADAPVAAEALVVPGSLVPTSDPDDLGPLLTDTRDVVVPRV